MKRSIGSIVLIVMLAACSSAKPIGDPCPQSSEPPTARLRSTASLKILEPVPGARVDRTNVRVRLELTGARIIKSICPNPVPNVGHVHLKLDGNTISLLAGLDVVLNDITKGPLSVGPHVLRTDFVELNHSPFNPQVQQSTSFFAQ